MRGKKAQMGISDAPSVVLVIGLTFLVMATVALIANQYGSAIPSDNLATIKSEAGFVNASGYRVSNASTACNFGGFSIDAIWNTTGGNKLSTGNYTITSNGYIKNATPVIWSGVSINYTHTYSGVACTTSGDLETEISNNTSIAGIVLTISLVGIVLTILIGVFVSVRRPRL